MPKVNQVKKWADMAPSEVELDIGQKQFDKNLTKMLLSHHIPGKGYIKQVNMIAIHAVSKGPHGTNRQKDGQRGIQYPPSSI